MRIWGAGQLMAVLEGEVTLFQWHSNVTCPLYAARAIPCVAIHIVWAKSAGSGHGRPESISGWRPSDSAGPYSSRIKSIAFRHAAASCLSAEWPVVIANSVLRNWGTPRLNISTVSAHVRDGLWPSTRCRTAEYNIPEKGLLRVACPRTRVSTPSSSATSAIVCSNSAAFGPEGSRSYR